MCRIGEIAPPLDVLNKLQYVAVTLMSDSVASEKEKLQSMVCIVAFFLGIDLDARDEPSTIPVIRAGSLIVPKSTQGV